MPKKERKAPPGPAPLRVKIEGDWAAAVGKALRTPAPPGGWPKPSPMPQRARKGKGKPKG